jgi:hypothetical protein
VSLLYQKLMAIYLCLPATPGIAGRLVMFSHLPCFYLPQEIFTQLVGFQSL